MLCRAQPADDLTASQHRAEASLRHSTSSGGKWPVPSTPLLSADLHDGGMVAEGTVPDKLD